MQLPLEMSKRGAGEDTIAVVLFLCLVELPQPFKGCNYVFILWDVDVETAPPVSDNATLLVKVLVNLSPK